MGSFLNIYGIAILMAGVWFVILSISNAVFFRVSRRRERKTSGSMLSILVPARNEEKRIVPTLRSLLDQDYDNFEVVVIDDNSTDKTWDILEAFTASHANLTILKGQALPEGWKGKPFAMSQLAAQAKGDIFVFVDADMVSSNDFLSWVAERMERHGADSMSAYARHRARSFIEYLAFPLIYLVNMTFLPFWLIKRTRTALFSHAIGQLMIFTREAYEGSGGFARVRDKILEDIQMGRTMKSDGYRHVFLDARNVLSGNMYDSWDHTVQGLKRSIYEYFDKKAYPLVILSFFIIAVLILPPFILLFSCLFGSFLPVPLLLGNLGIQLAWCINLYDRKVPWYVPFFFPFQFAFVIILAWISLVDDVSGRGYLWKDRTVR